VLLRRPAGRFEIRKIVNTIRRANCNTAMTALLTDRADCWPLLRALQAFDQRGNAGRSMS
jgi:hypothetical protein